MLAVLTYDIDQSDGGTRLRKLAKLCEGYGVRVQNSVFELQITQADLLKLKQTILNIIDVTTDSVRIYCIGKVKSNSLQILGKIEKIEITTQDTFIL